MEKEMSVDEKKETLFKNWLKFKKAETAAKDERYKVESEIENLYGDFDGMSTSFKEDKYKVSISKTMTTKLDQDKYIVVRQTIPSDLRPERIKFDLDKAGYDYLKANNKEIYTLVSDCVTFTPGKTTIKVEKVK